MRRMLHDQAQPRRSRSGLELSQGDEVVLVHGEDEIEGAKIPVVHLPRAQVSQIYTPATGRILAARIRSGTDMVVCRSCRIELPCITDTRCQRQMSCNPLGSRTSADVPQTDEQYAHRAILAAIMTLTRFTRGWLRSCRSAALVCGSALAGTLAQDVQAASPRQSIADFSFASQIGSGVYSAEGRTIQIYRLPLGWNIRDPGVDHWGIRLLMPVTLGFYDYRVEDVLQAPLPHSLDTASFVPGVELSHLAPRDWTLSLRGQVGIAKERTSTADALTWALGSSAGRSIDQGPWRLHFQTALIYAETHFRDIGKDAMLRLSTGLEARSGLHFAIRGHALGVGPYLLNEWYLQRPAPPLAPDAGRVAAVQWEAGVTFGSMEPLYLWKIPIPRLGIGFRFGDSLAALRLVFGSPF